MSLPVTAIVDRSWARSLRRFSQGNTIRYWINTRRTRMVDGTMTQPISSAEAAFIRRTLSDIDALTGLRFVETMSRHSSAINFYRVSRFEDDFVIGSAFRRRDHFEISWRNRRGDALTRQERYTIAHEIGHVLGLDHPYGRPFASRYDTCNTIMSYNPGRCIGFTDLDVAALRSLWGFA